MQEHIKITNTPPRVQYIGDGAQTEFGYTFAIFKPEDIEVFVDDQRLLGGFVVNGAGASVGGTVVLDVAPEEGALITVRRNIAIERITDFQPSGAFRARVINDELDYLTACLQQVAVGISSCLHLGPVEPVVDLTLPAVAARAGRILSFDSDGRPAMVNKTSLAADISHATLRGLGDDSHPQYLTGYRADTWLATKSLDDLGEGLSVKRFTSAHRTKLNAIEAGAAANPARVSADEALAGIEVAPRTFSPRDVVDMVAIHGGGSGGGSGGASVHGYLIGLDGDDHPHYLTAERANDWLAAKSSDDVAEGGVNRYMRLAGSGAAATAARSDHDHDGAYEPAFAKGTAFNRDFGSVAGSVAAGDHGHDAGNLTSGVLAAARLPLLGGDSGAGGSTGAAPAPAAGDATAGKYLCADGTWRVPGAGGGGISAGVSFPSTPRSGDAVYRTDLGCLFFYDLAREKWLGELESDGAGYNGDSGNVYLRRYNGADMSATVGIYLPYDVTIVGLSMAWDNARIGNIHVVRDGVDVGTVSIAAPVTQVADMTLNFDFAANGIMAFRTSGHTSAMTSLQLRCWWRRRG